MRVCSKDGSRHVTDEKFNTISHLLALMFSLIGGPWLIIRAVEMSPWHVVGASLYTLGLVGLFLCSTLHHGLSGSPRLEESLRSLDYAAIFLLIGGTFSPFCLTVARGPLGWTILAVVWGVGLGGLAWRCAVPSLPRWLTMTLYVGLGWVAVLLGPVVWREMGAPAAVGLAVGGLLYTGGGWIYVNERPNPVPGRFGFHEIWHLFVIAGAATHFAVLAMAWE